MNVSPNATSSKTLYLATNKRSIKRMREEQEENISSFDLNISSSDTSVSSEKVDKYYKSIKELSLKEKSKNFLECYDDLVLLITQKSL